MSNNADIYQRFSALEDRVTELEKRTTPLSIHTARAQLKQIDAQHAVDNTDPPPTPPPHWDEWAMEKAQAVQRRVFKDIGLDNKQINAIHSALIEAMRFAMPTTDQAAMVGSAPKYRHKPSSREYMLLGFGNLQTDMPLSDMAAVAIYQGPDGQLWAREAREFGERFTKV